jgi:hypothetical protein
MNEHLTTLEGLMARHDWLYDYCDDYTVWCRGRDQRAAINSLQRQLIADGMATAEEITVLTDKYKPKGY